MRSPFRIGAALTAALFALATLPLSAATITSLGGVASVLPSESLETPGYSWIDQPGVQTTSVRGQYRSPFATSRNPNAGYYSIQQGEAFSLATDAGRGAALTLLWGTIDTRPGWNVISLFLNGDLVETVNGADVVNAGAGAPGASLVQITDVLFDTVQFSANRDAFEFASVSVDLAPVPLPATGWMLLAAFGGAAVWRARSKAA